MVTINHNFKAVTEELNGQPGKSREEGQFNPIFEFNENDETQAGESAEPNAEEQIQTNDGAQNYGYDHSPESNTRNDTLAQQVIFSD